MNHEKITKALDIYDDIVNGWKVEIDEVKAFIESYPEFEEDDAYLYACLGGVSMA